MTRKTATIALRRTDSNCPVPLAVACVKWADEGGIHSIFRFSQKRTHNVGPSEHWRSSGVFWSRAIRPFFQTYPHWAVGHLATFGLCPSYSDPKSLAPHS